MTKSKSFDYSESFYREHSERYGVVQHAFTQSTYPNASHPALGDDIDLLLRLIELTHGRKAEEPAYNFTGSEDNEIMTVIDSDYGDAVRSFQLYDEKEILKALEALGLRLIEYEEPEKIGGMVYFRDSKPVDHCVFYLRKGE